jgi:hypothetical protein
MLSCLSISFILTPSICCSIKSRQFQLKYLLDFGLASLATNTTQSRVPAWREKLTDFRRRVVLHTGSPKTAKQRGFASYRTPYVSYAVSPSVFPSALSELVVPHKGGVSSDPRAFPLAFDPLQGHPPAGGIPASQDSFIVEDQCDRELGMWYSLSLSFFLSFFLIYIVP